MPCTVLLASVQVLALLEGEAARDRLGWSVAAGGDVNNDGQLGVVAGLLGRDVTLPPVPPKTRGTKD